MTTPTTLLLISVIGGLSVAVRGKIYDRCELALELRDKHNIPEDQIAVWVCIARYESEFNTTAIGHANWDGSGDHGIFQISDLYWCSPPGKGWACDVTCAELEDDDLTDDVECIKRIHEEHQHLSGDGFNAWAVYPKCRGGEAQRFIEGCFEPGEEIKPTTTSKPSFKFFTKSTSFYPTSKPPFKFFTKTSTPSYYSSKIPFKFFTKPTSQYYTSTYKPPFKFFTKSTTPFFNEKTTTRKPVFTTKKFFTTKTYTTPRPVTYYSIRPSSTSSSDYGNEIQSMIDYYKQFIRSGKQ